MKTNSVLLTGTFLFFGIFIAGCIDTSSPENTVGSLVEAVKKNQKKDVDALLINGANEIYSDFGGIAKLRSKLNGYKKIGLGKVHLIGEKDSHRFYELDLLGKTNPKDFDWDLLWNQKIDCYYWTVVEDPVPSPCSPHKPVCDPRPQPPRSREYENCQIFEINL